MHNDVPEAAGRFSDVPEAAGRFSDADAPVAPTPKPSRAGPELDAARPEGFGEAEGLSDADSDLGSDGWDESWDALDGESGMRMSVAKSESLASRFESLISLTPLRGTAVSQAAGNQINKSERKVAAQVRGAGAVLYCVLVCLRDRVYFVTVLAVCVFLHCMRLCSNRKDATIGPVSRQPDPPAHMPRAFSGQPHRPNARRARDDRARPRPADAADPLQGM